MLIIGDVPQEVANAISSALTRLMQTMDYGIGRYISQNSRGGFWGTDAIETISRQLSAELPGIRGFSARNLRNMRTFYEEWRAFDSNLADASAKTPEENALMPMALPSEPLWSTYCRTTSGLWAWQPIRSARNNYASSFPTRKR